ncbi:MULTISPECIES: hypothetical protein [unclassified Pseudoxanthomonas]|uniref:hypothetical protein n=1 Tax=unclassified Pseudoxanthomonas TaxID=2645906 RepID=UPI00160EA8CA|nr:hypothetical protein [Pseudoxanthomonas sp. OG2]MBD9376357.1 hypothetical protein [Pseudoxanthomonas sp. PXM04]MBV7474123.1 hypothetical protein [Pseudoxanthomonas sp. PXM05]
MGEASSSICRQAARGESLLALLARDDLDAAIDAGLMDIAPCSADCACVTRLAPIWDAQRRLRTAWEARERHRARQARLLRRAAERDARRMPAPAAPQAPRPSLPPSAAAILARAKARAAGKSGS